MEGNASFPPSGLSPPFTPFMFPFTKLPKFICIDQFCRCILVSSSLFDSHSTSQKYSVLWIRDAWGTEHRQDLSPWQRLLWAAWHPDSIVGGGGERETERQRREKGGCGIRQPHFSPLGLYGLLVFTCRISIKTENVRETECCIKTEIRARDRHCVLGVCWTHVLLVSSGSKCPLVFQIRIKPT